MSVRVIDHSPIIIAKVKVNGPLAIRRALEDVKRLSKPKTPFSGGRVLASGKKSTSKGGHLRDSVLVQVLGLNGRITWDKAYAQYQEKGMRRDGSHRVRNYTTSGTGTRFAESTIKEVWKNKNKYLKGLLR